MTKYVDLSGKPFHFIGIGGIGMSALAYILAKRKLPVSGSDIRSSHITEKLASLGAQIFSQQEATNLEFFLAQSHFAQPALPAAIVGSNSTEVLKKPGQFLGKSLANKQKALPQVICSTAINPANLEYRAALDLGCPIFHRSDLLSALIQEYNSIAVAGTHGKTTTSSMIGYLLLKAGLDPTIIVGGEVKAWEGNARLGKSEYLVAEADESDGSLVKLAAQIGVITNTNEMKWFTAKINIFSHFFSSHSIPTHTLQRSRDIISRNRFFGWLPVFKIFISDTFKFVRLSDLYLHNYQLPVTSYQLPVISYQLRVKGKG